MKALSEAPEELPRSFSATVCLDFCFFHNCNPQTFNQACCFEIPKFKRNPSLPRNYTLSEEKYRKNERGRKIMNIEIKHADGLQNELRFCEMHSRANTKNNIWHTQETLAHKWVRCYRYSFSRIKYEPSLLF